MQTDDTTTFPGSKDHGHVVLQVLPALVTGGVEQGTVDVAAALAARGDRALVASSGGPLVHQLDRVGAGHITLPLHRRGPASVWLNARRIEHAIRTHGVEIVHARSRAPAWSAFLAARRTGARFMTTFHGTYNFSGPIKRGYNAVMLKGERVIAISHFIAEHIQANYALDPARLRVVPRGVDLGRFNPDAVHQDRIVELATRWHLPDGVPVVMLPGRLSRWKGHRVLIEALALLREQGFCCLLVGSDQGRTAYRRELEDLIVARGLGDRVSVRTDCRDMPAAYMLADAVVSASTDPEAFGRIATEAQAMGRPLVAAAHGGVPEQVLEGETTCLVRPGDAEDLARGLSWALSLDAPARAHVAALGRMQARHFSKETMCHRTLAVYDELLTGVP